MLCENEALVVEWYRLLTVGAELLVITHMVFELAFVALATESYTATKRLPVNALTDVVEAHFFAVGTITLHVLVRGVAVDSEA